MVRLRRGCARASLSPSFSFPSVRWKPAGAPKPLRRTRTCCWHGGRGPTAPSPADERPATPCLPLPFPGGAPPPTAAPAQRRARLSLSPCLSLSLSPPRPLAHSRGSRPPRRCTARSARAKIKRRLVNARGRSARAQGESRPHLRRHSRDAPRTLPSRERTCARPTGGREREGTPADEGEAFAFKAGCPSERRLRATAGGCPEPTRECALSSARHRPREWRRARPAYFALDFQTRGRRLNLLLAGEEKPPPPFSLWRAAFPSLRPTPSPLLPGNLLLP